MKARYDKKLNQLVEISEMDEPELPDAVNYGNAVWQYKSDVANYEINIAIYNDLISKLRTLPCADTCKGLWLDSQEVVEGVEYEVRPVAHINGNLDRSKRWTETAFPITVKSEDELWGQMMDEITDKFLVIDYDNFHLKDIAAIDYLKSRYTITKKQ